MFEEVTQKLKELKSKVKLETKAVKRSLEQNNPVNYLPKQQNPNELNQTQEALQETLKFPQVFSETARIGSEVPGVVKLLNSQRHSKEDLLTAKKIAKQKEHQMLLRRNAAVKIQALYRGWQTRKEVYLKFAYKAKLAGVINQFRVKFVGRKVFSALSKKEDDKLGMYKKFLNYSAVYLQKWWRGFRVRKLTKPLFIQRKQAKAYIKGLVQGWKTRKVISSKQVQSQVSAIKDITQLLREVSPEDSFYHQMASQLPNAKNKFVSEFSKVYNQGTWIYASKPATQKNPQEKEFWTCLSKTPEKNFSDFASITHLQNDEERIDFSPEKSFSEEFSKDESSFQNALTDRPIKNSFFSYEEMLESYSVDMLPRPENLDSRREEVYKPPEPKERPIKMSVNSYEEMLENYQEESIQKSYKAEKSIEVAANKHKETPESYPHNQENLSKQKKHPVKNYLKKGSKLQYNPLERAKKASKKRPKSKVTKAKKETVNKEITPTLEKVESCFSEIEDFFVSSKNYFGERPRVPSKVPQLTLNSKFISLYTQDLFDEALEGLELHYNTLQHSN